MILIDRILLLLLIIPLLVIGQENNGSNNTLSVEIVEVPSREILPLETIFKNFQNPLTTLSQL